MSVIELYINGWQIRQFIPYLNFQYDLPEVVELNFQYDLPEVVELNLQNDLPEVVELVECCSNCCNIAGSIVGNTGHSYSCLGNQH